MAYSIHTWSVWVMDVSEGVESIGSVGSRRLGYKSSMDLDA